MFDCHVHPDYSPDATGSIEEYCRRAREIGLSGICFTTHYEPDPERSGLEWVMVRGRRRPVSSDWPVHYLGDIARARVDFPNLRILAGIEVGYEPGVDDIVGKLLGSHRFDYVLGAIHCLDHVAISSRREVEQMRELVVPKGARWAANRYFDCLEAAGSCGLFDCIAHLDIYRKYLLPCWQGTAGAQEFSEVADERTGLALTRLAEHGVGIEVNSSAIRRGQAEPYPSLAILSRARPAGVAPFTIGSDSHSPDELGSGLAVVQARVRRLGAEPAVFVDREPQVSV